MGPRAAGAADAPRPLPDRRRARATQAVQDREGHPSSGGVPLDSGGPGGPGLGPGRRASAPSEPGRASSVRHRAAPCGMGGPCGPPDRAGSLHPASNGPNPRRAGRTRAAAPSEPERTPFVRPRAASRPGRPGPRLPATGLPTRRADPSTPRRPNPRPGAERTRRSPSVRHRAAPCGTGGSPIRAGSPPGAPNEPNRPRRTNPSLPAERTRDPAPSEPDGRLRFASVRDRAGPDPGPGARLRIGRRADCQRPSLIIAIRGRRVLLIRTRGCPSGLARFRRSPGGPDSPQSGWRSHERSARSRPGVQAPASHLESGEPRTSGLPGPPGKPRIELHPRYTPRRTSP